MKKAYAVLLIHKLQNAEGGLIKGAAMLTVGMTAARVLGILFTVILAAVFLPTDFGAIRYAITLGTLAAIVSQPFGQHVVARFIGKYKNNVKDLNSIGSNVLLIQGGLIFMSAVGCATVLLFLGKFNLGILIVFLGTSVFYTYWGASSGFLAYGKLCAAYLGSNLVQLALVVLMIQWFQIHSPLLAVMIYGLSYFLPLVLLQIYRPLPLRFQSSFIEKKRIFEISKFFVPIGFSHACYIITTALPILALEYFFGMTDVGIYSLATTLGSMFIFVPASISTLVMPKTSGLHSHHHMGMLKRVLLLSTTFNGVLLIFFVLFLRWGIEFLFEDSYLNFISVFYIQALASIIFGVNAVIAAVIVGAGRPEFETISRTIVLGVTFIGLWQLVPVHGLMGAAVAVLAGDVAGLLVYGPILFLGFAGKPRPVE